ncbi:MAG TPA: thiamine pyrophosphate-binding protein [Bacteroidia bacterium]|nr:thiamine pyrophosphate-binding protein [Bacteroidia bacterium]
MKASDYIALFLEKKGIDTVFELSGGMITHLLDSLNQKTKINIVTMHHEQAAAFAADGYARVKNIPGVALATSGPGATNLLTGIGSCYFDSVPAIFITGQVNRHEQKGDRKIRQLGFQETDIVSMAQPITKAAFLVNNPQDLPEILENAFQISTTGRPGPVLLDIPMDVQRALIEVNNSFESSIIEQNIHPEVLKNLVECIQLAQKPLILAGRGVQAAGAKSAFNELVEKTGIPVITTLLGIDAIAYNDPKRVGFIGSYGNRWSNMAFGDCDLLIVLGSRLDIRQTGADADFIANRKIFHVDCESGEINNRVKNCIPIVADLKYFISSFLVLCEKLSFPSFNEWREKISKLKKEWPDTEELKPNGINPNKLMHTLSSASQLAAGYLADVGSHQMWSAQSLEILNHQFFLTSGGMGAMGFALPASIGASIALNKKPVVVILGDGCMQLNIQELQTIVRNKLPIKIIVLNNQTLGMIRQFQDSYFESRYQSTYWGYDTPDFTKVAEAYGLKAQTVSKQEQLKEVFDWIWNEQNVNDPVLIQVMIDPHTNTYPKIAFGRPITEMEPMAKPIGMEST